MNDDIGTCGGARKLFGVEETGLTALRAEGLNHLLALPAARQADHRMAASAKLPDQSPAQNSRRTGYEYFHTEDRKW
jgi:hypothetical protein